MKKHVFTFIVAAGIALWTMPVFAATSISFSPTAINSAPDKQFTLSITVNPQGAKNYAEKIELNFPADLLKVVSFNQSNGWMALTEAGYDSIDNTKGIVIKSAGYPSGISSPSLFGTVTFQIKKSGAGMIKIGNNSLAFEASNQNPISGNGVSVNSELPVVKTVVAPIKTNQETSGGIQTASLLNDVQDKAIENEIDSESSLTSEQVNDQNQNLAAVAGTSQSGGNNYVWFYVFGAIVIVLAVFISMRISRKKKNYSL